MCFDKSRFWLFLAKLICFMTIFIHLPTWYPPNHDVDNPRWCVVSMNTSLFEKHSKNLPGNTLELSVHLIWGQSCLIVEKCLRTQNCCNCRRTVNSYRDGMAQNITDILRPFLELVTLYFSTYWCDISLTLYAFDRVNPRPSFCGKELAAFVSSSNHSQIENMDSNHLQHHSPHDMIEYVQKHGFSNVCPYIFMNA